MTEMTIKDNGDGIYRDREGFIWVLLQDVAQQILAPQSIQK